MPVLASNAVMSHPPLKKQMPFPQQVTSATQIASRSRATYWYVSALLTLTAAAALLALNAQAQTAEPAAPAATAPLTPPAQSNTEASAAAPKYAAKDIERAFGYIDANKDNRITREEAAGFRGVAKHFDEADTNKDGMLSREEFENALNRGKPQ